jgi:hypothetical protein
MIKPLIKVIRRKCNMGCYSVFKNSAHKLVIQAISNGRIQALNEYLETFKGQQLGLFRDG